MMKIRTPIGIGLTFTLFGLVSTLLVPASKSQEVKTIVPREIPVHIKPLKAGNALAAVEVQCEPILLEKPDTIESYTCFFVNGSNRGIRSFGILHSVLFDTRGKTGRTDRLYAIDTYIHPDISAVKQAFLPNDKRYIGPPGPIVQPGSVITALEIEPVYVAFSDGTTVGSDARTIKQIEEIRQGASNQKQALRQEYFSRGRLVTLIIPLLFEDPVGNNQDSLSLNQRTGANAYRQFLREKYEKVGSAAVDKILRN